MYAVIRSITSLVMSLVVMLASFFSAGTLPFTTRMPDLEAGEYGQWVNPFVGTGGAPYMSGMTFPGAVSPYGAVKLSPDTSSIGDLKIITSWATGGYNYAHNYIIGFSHTRLSGTGAADMAHFRVTPSKGFLPAKGLLISHNDEIATAGYYAVNLPTEACMAELTATTHVGAHRYTFRTREDAHIFIDVTSCMPGGSALEGEVFVNSETGEISGSANIRTTFTGRYGGLKAYFVAEFNDAWESFATVSGNEKVDGRASVEGTDIGVDFNFGNKKGEPIELKLAISFVSVENARKNLEAEAGNLDFDGIRALTRKTWDSYLSRIDIKGNDTVKTNFYTALYHSMIMPTTFTDVNGEYTNFNKETAVADGFIYRTDMSLWDTFRTTIPLQTLIAPEIQLDTVRSLIEMAKIKGVFPRWPSGTGETSSMFGTPADMIITESWLKGYTDFDIETAYEIMKETAFTNYENLAGRGYYDLYSKYGYCPADMTDNKSVSRTLEYCWADYSLYLLATALGKTEDASEFLKNSYNYLNLWDEENQCFRAKNSDGSWYEPFTKNWTSYVDDIIGTKFAYGFCEGSARQWQWSVPYDGAALVKLYGGEEKFTETLDEFMSDANTMRNALVPSSGYWHGNQHDLHAIYMFNESGHPELTQKWARWAMDTRYASAPDGLDGNDDGGTLSAWYVLSAVGLYPISGTDIYWLGSPAVDSAVLNLGNGKKLTVIAENQSEKNVYVSSVTLNGQRLDKAKVTHAMLAEGGTLKFVMTDKPTENGGY